MNISDGLDYVLGHFQYPNHFFPRTISTGKTQNRQIKVYSKKEVLDYFWASDLKDCRISAFGVYEQENLIPNLIFVDLDNRDWLNKALWLFHSTIKSRPTVLDTGNGYAILQPIQMKSWNGVSQGTKDSKELTRLFLPWVERYLTNSKCDMANHPSLRNTMIRVPGSYNTKLLDRDLDLEQSRVKVVYGWNKKRVEIDNIRLEFIKYVKKIISQERRIIHSSTKVNPKKFQWIEQLFNYKLQDGRNRILYDTSRYLINLQEFSIEDAAEKICSWLNSKHYLKSRISYECKRAQKDKKYPRLIDTIKHTDPELYGIISEKITNF